MGLFDKFKNWLKRKGPSKPKRLVGHRGIAMGLRKKPYKGRTGPEDLAAYQELLKYESETIGLGEIEDFLAGTLPIYVNSSNVASALYHPSTNKMDVAFLDGATYRYSNISEDEALSFTNAQSKGSWVWDNLRVRGSKTKHKKPFQKISASMAAPKRQDTAQRRQAEFDKEWGEFLEGEGGIQ